MDYNSTQVEALRTFVWGVRTGNMFEWAVLFDSEIPDETYFSGIWRTIYQLIQRFMVDVGRVPTEDDIDRMVSLADGRRKQKLKSIAESWEQLEVPFRVSPTPNDFKVIAESLVDYVLNQRFRATLTKAASIYSEGRPHDGKQLYGRQDAISYFMSQLGELSPQRSMTAGDIMVEGRDVLAEYEAAKTGKARTILCGITPVDEILGGIGKGELLFLQGFTGHGKTTLCINMIYNAVVVEQKNVAYVTLESSREVVRRRFYTCHANTIYDTGFSYRALKAGLLDKDGETILSNVINDLHKNDSYGKLFVVQAAEHTTVSTIRPVLERYQAASGIDLLAIDYAALLDPDVKTGNHVQDARQVILALGDMARSWNNGQGIPIISPWQVSREAWREAKNRGYYIKGTSAETSEVEKRADAVLTLLLDEDTGEATCRFIKVRDGAPGRPFTINFDFDSMLVSADGAGRMTWLD